MTSSTFTTSTRPFELLSMESRLLARAMRNSPPATEIGDFSVFSPVPKDPPSGLLVALKGPEAASPTNIESPTESEATATTIAPPRPRYNKPLKPRQTRIPFAESLLSPPLEQHEPDTPSSTVVEFGDKGQNKSRAPSAAELVESVHQSYSNTQSRSASRSRSHVRATSETREGRRGSSKSSNVREVVQLDRSQSSRRRTQTPESRYRRDSRSSNHERSSSVAQEKERELSRTRVSMFLQQMAPQVSGYSEKELLLENRQLQKQLANMQRKEEKLQAENQDLTRQFDMLKQHHEVRRRQWRDDFQSQEEKFALKLQQAREEIARHEATIVQLKRKHAKSVPPLLTDNEVESWFGEKEITWRAWAQDFASRDPNTLSSKLHPSQLEELTNGVKGFVQLDTDGKLPKEILGNPKDMIPVLLQGMLTNFICNETLGSPFWVFGAISTGTIESPLTPGPNSTFGSSTQYRVDPGIFNELTPFRSVFTPTPGSALFSPPGLTSRRPPPLVTPRVVPVDMGPSTLGFPSRFEMESLYHMLFEAQDTEPDITVHHWRSYMIRLFADSGMGVEEPCDAGANEVRRLLVEARQNQARKLRDRFLGGPARFLLKDQQPSGIEKLERRLTQHLDDALRFSCQMWSRLTPLRIHGLKDLADTPFTSNNQLMSVCHAQAPPTQPIVNFTSSPRSPPRQSPRVNPLEGRPVIMVVQPAIEAIGMNGNGNSDPPYPVDADDISRIWLRARVVASVPPPPPPPQVTVKSSSPKSVSAVPPPPITANTKLLPSMFEMSPGPGSATASASSPNPSLATSLASPATPATPLGSEVENNSNNMARVLEVLAPKSFNPAAPSVSSMLKGTQFE